MNRRQISACISLLGSAFLWTASALGAESSVLSWNSIAVKATLAAGENAIVQSRTLAIVHVAIHDALNGIHPRYAKYSFTGSAQSSASPEAAIAAAARNSLLGAIVVGSLPFPQFGTPALQAVAAAQVEQAYSDALAAIPDGLAKSEGIAVGQAAANSILSLRSGDNATRLAPYQLRTEPGAWQPTPNPIPFDPPVAADHLAAVLPGWGQVKPFVLRRSSQFEPEGPPSLAGRHYARDYNEVKALGEQHSKIRTDEQSAIARFWYENSPASWSRIAGVVALSAGLDPWDTARLLALVNLAMADGFVAGFETKYDFNFWRPVTAIRAGATDGNPATEADPDWSSFLDTPAIPDYPSTHSILGSAASEVLRRFFHDDSVSFTTSSGVPFAASPNRSFTSFSQAAIENGESRIYAGIHFRSAVEDGIQQGRNIGRFVFLHVLRPLDRDDDRDGDDDNHDHDGRDRR